MFIYEFLIHNLVHGTNADFDDLDVSKSSDGGIHFGTEDQAKMRSAGKNSRLLRASIDIQKPKRYKDDGGNWKKKIAAAKRAGYDSIVYLNRYEGLTTERIEHLSEIGKLDKLDNLSYTAFKKLVPEAEDSYIVFSNEQIKAK